MRRLATAVRIEYFCLEPRRLQYPGEPPNAERGCEERIFTAVRIVWPDEQYRWQVDCVHLFEYPRVAVVVRGRQFEFMRAKKLRVSEKKVNQCTAANRAGIFDRMDM